MPPIGDIQFTKGQGGLGRTLPGTDHYSGLVIYCDTKPANWPAGNIKLFTTMSDVEAAGIVSDSAENQIKVLHYHLERFFDVYTEKQAKAQIWVMIADVPAGAYDYEEITTIVNFADGDIRNVAVYLDVAFATTQVTAIKPIITALETAHKPISVLLAADFKDVADMSVNADLRALDTSKVSVTIGQDGAGIGAALFGSIGKSITNLGSMLGWASWKNVSWNLGWPEQFNTVLKSEFDTPALANGNLVKDKLSQLDGLHDKGYNFLIKRIGLSGTYFQDANTCVSADSDYAYLENNQTIDKAIRGIYSALAPKISSPINIDAETGKIDILTISHFENLAGKPLDAMMSANEISGFEVFIDPDQDVLSTSKLIVTVTLVVNGVARNIDIPISFVKSVN